jgi:hypothetical protein
MFTDNQHHNTHITRLEAMFGQVNGQYNTIQLAYHSKPLTIGQFQAPILKAANR